MKRTTLLLDERLLDEAKRLADESSDSLTVNRALSEFVRRARAGKIIELAGSGVWEGDIAVMRRDTPKARPARVRRDAGDSR